MNLKERVQAFVRLGKEIQTLPPEVFKTFSQQAQDQNPWFTQDSVHASFRGISKLLDETSINKWVSTYQLTEANPKIIGIAMAGNIPLVGFHDYLAILIAGHKALIKLSAKDSYLLPEIAKILAKIEPRFEQMVSFEDRLKGYDAAIATGSDNTARYFKYYFRNVPHIIRKNRTSCAVIQGMETSEELEALGTDVFTYFGLGCRNVSKLFVPEEYDFQLLMQTWEKFGDVINHHKYANNYDYQRAIHLVNRVPFFDNGSVLLFESDQLVSPISALYYERYKDQNDLRNKIGKRQDKIQCVVSAKGWFKSSLAFGEAQYPEVADYADDVDTLQFLSTIG